MLAVPPEPDDAVRVTVSSAPTGFVPMLKVAELVPAANATVDGNLMSELAEAKETEAPPLPAAGEIVTVPLAALPPMRVAGVITRLLTWNGLTVKVAVLEVPLNVAVTVTVVAAVTDCVVMVNLALPDVPVMFTDAGTDATLGVELLSVTVSPPAAATPLMVTVPVAVA